MQSDIGDLDELRRVGSMVRQHLPAGYQNHIAFDCVCEFNDPPPTGNYIGEATVFGSSALGLDGLDHFAYQRAFPKSTPEGLARFGVPGVRWNLFGALARWKNRGCLLFTATGLATTRSIEIIWAKTSLTSM
jgi:choline dehydrogenase